MIMESKDLFRFSEVEFQEEILNTAAFKIFIRFKDCNKSSIVGSVVECSPATRAAWVRFPDDAYIFDCKQALQS